MQGKRILTGGAYGKGDKEPEEALEDVVGESEAVDTSINTIADDVDKLNDAKLSDAYQEVNNNINTSEENLAKQAVTEDIKSAFSDYIDSVNADKKLTEAREAGLEGLKASEQSISEAETLIEAKNQQIEDISATITTATTIEEATQNYNKAVEVQKEVQQIYDNAANEALAAQVPTAQEQTQVSITMPDEFKMSIRCPHQSIQLQPILS